jgi:hypothetical protein
VSVSIVRCPRDWELTLLFASTLPQPSSSVSRTSTVISSPRFSKSSPIAFLPFSAHSTIPLSVRYKLVTNWLLTICSSLLLGGTTTSTEVLVDGSTYSVFCRLFSKNVCTAMKRCGKLVVSLRSGLRVQSSSTLSFSASVFHAAHTACTQRSRTLPNNKRKSSFSRDADPESASLSDASSLAAVPTKTSVLDK